MADRAAEFCLQFLRDARGGGARGDAPRLGMADEPVDATAQFEQDLGELRGLARAGLAADDYHLVFGNRLRDVGAARADRQFLRVLGLRASGAALREFGGGVSVLLWMHAPAVGLPGLHPAHSTGSGEAVPELQRGSGLLWRNSGYCKLQVISTFQIQRDEAPSQNSVTTESQRALA